MNRRAAIVGLMLPAFVLLACGNATSTEGSSGSGDREGGVNVGGSGGKSPSPGAGGFAGVVSSGGTIGAGGAGAAGGARTTLDGGADATSHGIDCSACTEAHPPPPCPQVSYCRDPPICCEGTQLLRCFCTDGCVYQSVCQ